VKRGEEIVEIPEAYDLTGSYRAAAELAVCDHHTVARYTALREAGQPPVAGPRSVPVRRPRRYAVPGSRLVSHAGQGCGGELLPAIGDHRSSVEVRLPQVGAEHLVLDVAGRHVAVDQRAAHRLQKPTYEAEVKSWL
jgi:hypothetical protein